MEEAINKKGIENIREKYRCRITVLRKSFNEEFYKMYPYGAANACGRLEEGQTFFVDNRWDPPEGFCLWAWSDLRPSLHSIFAGHPVPMIACCTDGLRPVTFKLERME